MTTASIFLVLGQLIELFREVKAKEAPILPYYLLFSEYFIILFLLFQGFFITERDSQQKPPMRILSRETKAHIHTNNREPGLLDHYNFHVLKDCSHYK